MGSLVDDCAGQTAEGWTTIAPPDFMGNGSPAGPKRVRLSTDLLCNDSSHVRREFNGVYYADLPPFDPNPLELNQEIRAKIPNLLRWARMMEQKTIETRKLRYALWKSKRASRIHKIEGSGSPNFIHIHS